MTNAAWKTAVDHLSATDSVLRRIIERYGPCTLSPKADYFAVLCNSIVSQQLAVKAADAIYTRFAAHFGGVVTPDRLLDTPPDQLRALGLSGRKVIYMLDLAARVHEGSLTPDRFPAMADDAIVGQLTGVKGIGVWTAHMFLIFALNRPDVLPTGDFGVRKAFMLAYGLDAMPFPADMELRAAPWRPWRSIGSWYLWRSLENK